MKMNKRVGVFPWDGTAIVLGLQGEATDSGLWSDAQYNQCGQSMSDKREYIMAPAVEAEWNQRWLIRGRFPSR